MPLPANNWNLPCLSLIHIYKAEAGASITGATGTGFELHSWFTAQTGMDVNGVHYGAGEMCIRDRFSVERKKMKVIIFT